jgi:VanZ family protein
VPASRLVAVWLPLVAWAALIFVLSSQPDLSTGLGVWDTILRKAGHTVEYAVLGALLVRALGSARPAIAAGIAYAATDEVHQGFVPGRHASLLDVAIDAVGVVAGVLLIERLRR